MVAGADELVAERGRPHARGADLVDGVRADVLGNADAERHLAGRDVPDPGLDHLAEDRCSRSRPARRRRARCAAFAATLPSSHGGDGGERSADLAEGGPRSAEDDGSHALEPYSRAGAAGASGGQRLPPPQQGLAGCRPGRQERREPLPRGRLRRAPGGARRRRAPRAGRDRPRVRSRTYSPTLSAWSPRRPQSAVSPQRAPAATRRPAAAAPAAAWRSERRAAQLPRCRRPPRSPPGARKRPRGVVAVARLGAGGARARARVVRSSSGVPCGDQNQERPASTWRCVDRVRRGRPAEDVDRAGHPQRRRDLAPQRAAGGARRAGPAGRPRRTPPGRRAARPCRRRRGVRGRRRATRRRAARGGRRRRRTGAAGQARVGAGGGGGELGARRSHLSEVGTRGRPA